MLGPIPSQGRRRNGQTGGEILSSHVHHNEGKQMCGLLPGLVHFRMVVPPLQPGVVGPYPEWGVWLPSRLIREGIGRIKNCGS
jgi:hypothetical protein